MATLNRRKQLEQDLEHITQEMYRRNLELTRNNTTLSLLRKIDSLVLESQGDLASLCHEISEAIAEAYEYPLVALFVDEGVEGQLGLSGWSAHDKTDLLAESGITRAHLDIDDAWNISAGAAECILLSDTSTKSLAEQLHCTEHTVKLLQKTLSLKSLCIVKLMAHQRLAGAMVVAFNHEVAQLSGTQSEYLDRLSGAVGVAVDNKLLFEENKRVLAQLQKTNKKLRVLDQTKDDFISMASHQLRTPLTSVKGYLSMVLEGDVGEINDKQARLLSQAFIGSQRMVYLIADLLNVSRLRTGKFILDPTPINLADAIDSEVSQLIETAAARGLTLTFDKPATFPVLTIDETKIRQVIMNFLDNAIYYTPTGGRIDVKLAESPTAITCTVTDDGIGVPKADQHRLFTKFFRAHNAKKARPDGTGLGLFMAQKVVIAHGGSVVFKSQENKGSTFGFTLPKPPIDRPNS